MQLGRTHLGSVGIELPHEVVTSDELDERLAPAWRALGLGPGAIESLTGIAERRWWEPDRSLVDAGCAAVQAALDLAELEPGRLGALVWASVARAHFEPATACHVARRLGQLGLGLPAHCALYDISNACLGAITAILQLAARIELGQLEAGVVVTCERARPIVELAIARLLAEPTPATFKQCFATLTGGAAAAAVVVCDARLSDGRRRLVGACERTAPAHADLCVWGVEPSLAQGASEPERLAARREFMRTDAAAVFEHGLALGRATWAEFLPALGWDRVDRTICHQVGAKHRQALLGALGLTEAQDFASFPWLGNTGSAALPVTLALAQQRGVLEPGQRVGLLGIGSGLACAMIGVEW